jgi:hypothetical protein
MGRTHLLALLATALAFAPAASAAPGMTIGLEDEAVFVNQTSTAVPAARGYQFLSQLRIRQMRIIVEWTEVSGAPGQFDFSPYDLGVAQARQQGMEIQLVLDGPAPAYATADGRQGVLRPDPQQFAAFVTAAVQHFSPQGISTYSMWNEPNYATWLAPLREAPQLYRALYLAGYAAIKAAQPSARVLLGETAPQGERGGRSTDPLAFLRSMACVNARYRPMGNCAQIQADGYAHHPYDFGVAPNRSNEGADNVTIGTLPNLNRALTLLNRSRRVRVPQAIYLTEFGYLASGRRGLPESRRAAYLRQAYRIARRARGVRQMIQYQLVQPTGAGAFTTGIVSATGRPLASFNALRSVSG